MIFTAQYFGTFVPFQDKSSTVNEAIELLSRPSIGIFGAGAGAFRFAGVVGRHLQQFSGFEKLIVFFLKPSNVILNYKYLSWHVLGAILRTYLSAEHSCVI